MKGPLSQALSPRENDGLLCWAGPHPVAPVPIIIIFKDTVLHPSCSQMPPHDSYSVHEMSPLRKYVFDCKEKETTVCLFLWCQSNSQWHTKLTQTSVLSKMDQTSCTWLFSPTVYSLLNLTPQCTDENIKPYPAGYRACPSPTWLEVVTKGRVIR